MLYMKMAETIRIDRFSSKSAEQRKRVCEGGRFSRIASKVLARSTTGKITVASSPVRVPTPLEEQAQLLCERLVT